MIAADSKKPRNLDEYKEWLKIRLNIELTSSEQKRYETVQLRIKYDFENSEYWRELTKEFRKYHEDYYSTHNGYDLFNSPPKPIFDLKPYDSFVRKTFCKNVLENKHWPDSPSSGWIVPANWFSRINDIVRTLLIVKYLDGVQFLVGRLCDYNHRMGIGFMPPSFEARETGYYAAHFYVLPVFEIPSVDWDTERTVVSIEIQVTTQLQETIRRLLHKHYERRRELTEKEPLKWQWDYKCEEFAANYLGHILHYIEGMIMDIREKQERKI